MRPSLRSNVSTPAVVPAVENAASLGFPFSSTRLLKRLERSLLQPDRGTLGHHPNEKIIQLVPQSLTSCFRDKPLPEDFPILHLEIVLRKRK